MRFDEMELQPVVLTTESEQAAVLEPSGIHAPRFKRMLAFLTDISLFVALSLALSPLLPPREHVWSLAGLAGFVLILSYYYFVGSWLLWGKTIGGAIFDVRVVGSGTDAMSLRQASIRWASTLLSLLIAGVPLLLASLPSRESLPDMLSGTRCTAA